MSKQLYRPKHPDLNTWIVGGLILVIGFLLIAISATSREIKQEQSCSSYAKAATMNSVPPRCLKYFTEHSE